MRILIVTQNEPFYLADNLKYLVSKLLQNNHQICGCVCLETSVFGKKLSFFSQAKKTYDVFGCRFFVHYTLKYVYAKLSKPSVRKILRDFKIPIVELQMSVNHHDSLSVVKSYSPDLIISILGNQIFKKPFLNLAPNGCINLHTSLLPKYRGIMPSFWVLKNNEKYTGVSVFFVDEGIDSGKILLQKKVLINSDDSQASLIRKTKKIGMELILQAVESIGENDVKLLDNPDDCMTYYSFPTKDDVREFYRNGKKFF